MEWKYHNKETGCDEVVELEKWMWAVMYEDGSELHQFDDHGVFHRMGEIDQSRVKLFSLYQPKGEGRVDIIVPKNAKLIHKYKNFVFDALTEDERKVRAYCIGYRIRGGYVYTYVKPDDKIVQAFAEEPDLTLYGIS